MAHFDLDLAERVAGGRYAVDAAAVAEAMLVGAPAWRRLLEAQAVRSGMLEAPHVDRGAPGALQPDAVARPDLA